MTNPLAADLDRLMEADGPPWETLRGARILLTGGTGFFGGWLLESLLHADDRLGLGVAVTVLTRNPEAFRAARPHLAGHRAVTLVSGDVRRAGAIEGRFSHVVHAATNASASMNLAQPRLMFETIVEGTRAVLEVARRAGARRFLLCSSGAVYGRQPPALSKIGEEHPGGPDPCASSSAYAEGKRVSEFLCALAGREGWLEPVIARGFAFSGPYLPLDTHFAIGNFVRDALVGGPVRVGGDGTPLRSFLYGADLAAWIWTLLVRGQSGRAYNVGSERELSIAQLAEMVVRELDVARGLVIAGRAVPGRPVERYVPSTRRAREEFSLGERWTLEEAIARMAQFALPGQGVAQKGPTKA